MKHFYVTMIRGERVAWLAGPYATHQEALDRVAEARNIACNVDPRSEWDAFGTTGVTTADDRTPKPGTIHHLLKQAA